VNAPKNLLESCWMLVDQDMMLDVAATIAATQPEIVAVPMRPEAVRPALSLNWLARERETARTF